MAQILLTGATGFIGDALLPALINDSYSLICLTRDSRTASKKYQYLNASVRWITNFDQLETMPEYVINLSGEGSLTRAGLIIGSKSYAHHGSILRRHW